MSLASLLRASMTRLRCLALPAGFFVMAAGAGFASAQNAASVPAPIKAEGAWVRASVQGQSGTGGFMRLTASEPLTLVGVQTPAARVAEIHEMKMEGDVMRMRPISELALPAGRAVELRPGGFHLMLSDLKAPLKDGTQVPLTLVLRDAKGAERRLGLQVPVALRAPGAPAASASAPAMPNHGAHGAQGGTGHRH